MVGRHPHAVETPVQFRAGPLLFKCFHVLEIVKKYKVLIANRGEIAIRIARSVRELGWIPLGIYTSIDKKSLHRNFVFEDREVSSYLDIDEILEAAEKLEADIIHPGYGFLSENYEFAEKVLRKGLYFVGPMPETMKIAEDKVKIKEIAKKIGISTLPWKKVESVDDVIKFGEKYGYPVIVKARFGGGGRGIRIINSRNEIESMIEQAEKEVESTFKRTGLYVEKYIPKAKHIEVQIIGDNQKILHLFERDCSLQRRHQKILEEAPATVLTKSERERILKDGIRLMEQIKYTNAGTVEMLFDLDARKHYFMEINARLQVEHPVTELITGIDIVKQQLLISIGKEMKFGQDDIRVKGHAIEARVYAENPVTMMPSPGKITFYREPGGFGVRVDSGVKEGSYVPAEYESMISKVIVHDLDRRSALAKLKRALSEYRIVGISTNLPLLWIILDHPKLRSGLYTTDFFSREEEYLKKTIKEKEMLHAAVAAAVFYCLERRKFTSKIKERVGEERVTSIKRRAWLYWMLLKRRLSRARARRKKR